MKTIDPRALPTHPEVARRKKEMLQGSDRTGNDAFTRPFIARGKHQTISRKLDPKSS